jgi:hypothetical protein
MKDLQWRTLQERAVLRLEGGKPNDLEARFAINQVLRSLKDPVDKITVIRKSSAAKLAKSSVPKTTLSAWEELGTYASELLKMNALNAANHYLVHGQLVPKKVKEVLVDLGQPLPLPPLDDLKDNIHEYQSVEWRISSLDARRMTRWPTNSKGLTTELPAPKALPAKGSVRLKDQQAWELFRKVATEYEDKMSTALRVVRLRKEMENLSWVEEDGVPVPKIEEAVTGLRILYKSSLDIPEDFHKYLADLYDNRGYRLLWYAPQTAVDDVGRPKEMTKEAQSKCYALITARDKKYSALKDSDIEVLAWQWLLISHNSVYPKHAVELPRTLRFGYSSRAVKKQAAPSQSKMIEELQRRVSSLVEEVKKPAVQGEVVPLASVNVFLDEVWGVLDAAVGPYANYDKERKQYVLFPELGGKAGFEDAVRLVNDLFPMARKLASGDAITPYKPLSETEQGHIDNFVEEVRQAITAKATPPQEAPEGIEHNGQLCVKIPLADFSKYPAGTIIYENGALYRIVQTASRDEVKTPPPPKDKSEGKGKGKKKASLPPSGSGGVTLQTPPPPPPKDSPSGVAEKKVDPIAKGGNPVHVKGVARSTALTGEQRDALRKFFNLPNEPVPSEQWSTMSKKEKTKASLARSIPKWAVSAVLRNPENLGKIVGGTLTKDNVNRALPHEGKSTPSQKRNNRAAEATKRWQEVKEKFPGVGLFARPQKHEEKDLKKHYDVLIEEFGKLPCFPKPRQHPSQQGKKGVPKAKGGSAGPGQADVFAQTLQLVNSLALAMAGRLTK